MSTENPGESESAPAAPAEGDATPIVETPAAPVEGEGAPTVEKTPEEQAAETAAAEKAKQDAEAAKLALPELLKNVDQDTLRRLGQRFANGTMAAARRAERAAQSIAAENAQLKAKLAEGSSAPDIRKDVAGWMKANGFTSARDLVDHLVAGGADKKPDPLDEVAKLRKEREEERAAAKAEADRRSIEDSRQNVAKALTADTTRWARVSSRTGQEILWGEIVEYSRVNGACPDEAVYYLADQVERELRAEFGDPAPRPAGKDAPAPAQGAPGASRSAKATTVTNRSTSSAPAVREYSLDPEEARLQVLADLRAEGLLKAAAE